MKNFKPKIKNYMNTAKLLGAMAAASLVPNNSDAQTPKEMEQINQIKKVQQEFSEQSRAMQLHKVYDWYTRAVDDSLEMAVFGNNALYDASNATVQTKPRSGIGVIDDISDDLLKIDNVPYVRMTMVGKSGARFRNEKTDHRDFTTTFPSMFNALNLNDVDSKRILSLYTGWDPKNISVKRDDNNKVINTTYSGPSNRHIIRNRQLDSGSSVEHARWMPGTEAYFPLDKVLKFVGYDLNLAKELDEKHSNFNEYITALEAKCDSLYGVVDSLKTDKEKLTIKTDSLASRSDSLTSAINRWDVSPMVGINSNKNIEAGLYATIGKLGVGAIYTFPTDELVSQSEDVKRSEPPQGRPTANKTSIRKTNTENYLDKHRIEGLIGYDLSDKFTLFGTAGFEIGKKTESITDHFWQEVPGPDGSVHIINEQLEQPKVISENYKAPVFGLGASVNLTDRLQLYGRGNFMPKNNSYQGSVGLKFNLRKNQNR